MLTAKQRELLLFIDARLKESGISPSFDEMREALDLKSKSGVHRLISALEERGFIRRLPNRARALDVVKMPETRPAATVTPLRPAAPAPANDTIDIPLHGRIAAGTPIEALQGTESFAVPAALLGPGEHYALEDPDELDLLVLPGPVLHDLGRPERVAPVPHRDTRGELRQEGRLLHGGIP